MREAMRTPSSSVYIQYHWISIRFHETVHVEIFYLSRGLISVVTRTKSSVCSYNPDSLVSMVVSYATTTSRLVNTKL